MIIIPELKFGNLNTIAAFLDHLNLKYEFKKIKELYDLKNVILLIPGNGNWEAYIKSGLIEIIRSNKNINIIGICGGFQIFFMNSEESCGDGASIINDKVIKLSNIIPTIGYKDIGNFGKMYFSNSYGVPFREIDDADIESYQYDGKSYIGSIKYKNLIGFQFHPEVSGKAGQEIFLNYIKDISFS